MTKNYEKTEEMAPPASPHSPEDQVMEFINTLGEHMQDAFSAAASPDTEKGDDAASEKEEAQGTNPPDYEQGEKPGESSTHAHRGRHERRGSDRRERPQWGGWGGDWRERGQGNPWAAMMGSFAEGIANNAPNPGMFFGGGSGPGACRGRGGFGGFGGRGNYHGPWGWGGHGHRGGRWGGHRHWQRGPGGDQEFIPAMDLFDTPESFVVHIALPGALKEDIGINYDFDNAELQVSGVIKLESNGKNVPVDSDGITAKLENGLLEVTVPKLRKADEPEKKKINIE
ncbi:hypothetical protein ABW21_db0202452 [Orbilia brochopaga]|nr:hypothetical protein ABW21_db0202452 [Drechslerella brochopaga]